MKFEELVRFVNFGREVEKRWPDAVVSMERDLKCFRVSWGWQIGGERFVFHYCFSADAIALSADPELSPLLDNANSKMVKAKRAADAMVEQYKKES